MGPSPVWTANQGTREVSHAPRVVLDTNVAVSALLFTAGRVAGVRRAWQEGRCRPLASKETTAELIRVLSYPKFASTVDEQRELLADYLPYCMVVRIPSKIPRIPRCRDAVDEAFLRLASAGKAEYLVTGDRDLLAVEARFACSIVDPDTFLRTLTT